MVGCSRSNLGLTLIELMTVLFIVILLAMVGFPVYQEYQNRANIAEAESVIGTTERHLRTYFLDHGSFYSAAPTPASVPGLASLGSSGTFTPAGGWLAIGSPVPNGSDVVFSYQAFAGQTPSGTTTPNVNSYLYNPTDDMNLIRRTANASNYRFPDGTGIETAEAPLRLDFGNFFDFSACAATAEENCITGCIDAGENPDQCKIVCLQDVGGKCDGKPGNINCYNNDYNSGADPKTDPFGSCVANCGDDEACKAQCLESINDCGSRCAGDDVCMQNCGRDYCRSKCTMGTSGQQQRECFAYCDGIDGRTKWPSDGHCYSPSPLDPDCEECMANEKANNGGPYCTEQLICPDGYDQNEQCGCIPMGTACPSTPPCIYGNCGAGGEGRSGGGDAGGGSGSGDSGGTYSGDGDAGGGSGSGSGDTSGGSGGTVNSSNNECSSFGITKATDFGIQQNVSNYNWAVMTAVASLSAGSPCTLIAKVLQVVDGQTTQTDFIRINIGE